ncbi:GGDEF domain-containing response regulator, partial [Magnetococcales bacterium HHB-1]
IMPEMDGFALLEWIRYEQGKSRNELAAIGLSAHGSNILSARFIKGGGNDFLSKPYLKEELICRVFQNIETLELIDTINETAQKDFLTGLYNRRHFFHLAQPLYSNAVRQNLSLTMAVMDIDHFKQINDTYGHYGGDVVLKAFAALLKESFRSTDIVARMGGEEFCVLASNVDRQKIRLTFKRFSQRLNATEIPFGNNSIKITISIGITQALGSSLDSMLQQADDLLYKAKKSGRNRIEIG